MPFKRSAHHGLSYVLGIAASVLLTEVLKLVFPDFLAWIDGQSLKLIRFFRIHASVRVVSVLLMAFIFVMLIGFSIGWRSRKR